MVSIHAGTPLSFTRSYITGFAVFRPNVSLSFEGLTFIINDELLGLNIRMKVNSKIYPASSHRFYLDEMFQEATASEIRTGLPAALDIQMWIDVPPGHRDFAVCLSYAELVEPPAFLQLPAPPAEYWRKLLPPE